MSIHNMLERLILKFSCGFVVAFEGRRSLSTSLIMQLCCLALAYVWVSLGAPTYFEASCFEPPPPIIALKSSSPSILIDLLN